MKNKYVLIYTDNSNNIKVKRCYYLSEINTIIKKNVIKNYVLITGQIREIIKNGRKI